MNASKIIETLGFPSVRGFQAAWNLGPALVVDGIIGPKTTAAALKSWNRHEDRLGDISAHFACREFTCHCGGQFEGCATLKIRRQLLSSLEKYRTEFSPHGVIIVSGYRCEQQNKAVRGAPGSMHLKGVAADIYGVVRYGPLESKHWFAGYGIASDGDVVHVDRRDLYDKATLTDPDKWWY